MSDELTNTSDVSGGGGSDPSTALSLSGDSGVAPQSGQVGTPAVTTAGESAAPSWESIVESIPDNDDDITQPTFQHVQGLKEQRTQIRTLAGALKESKPKLDRLSAYEQLGEPEMLQHSSQILQLLFSPLIDQRTGQPVMDPGTQTSHVTTVPFLQYLDENSPGMPEQLMVDLLNFRPTDENGQPTETLSRQILRHWGLDPERINQYRNIDKLLATSSGAVSQVELATVPPEYHDAYRNLPPSIRHAWDAYDEGDQLIILRNEKSRLDLQQQTERNELDRQRREMFDQQQYAQRVFAAQQEYVATVRTERFASIAQSLGAVTFSTDNAINTVFRGAVLATVANLIDPELRFVTQQAVAALGVKLDHTFDEALDSFNTNAAQKVALEMQGDVVRARDAGDRANSAANLLVTKLGIIALKVAKAMGGQQQAAAATQGQALATATSASPVVGGGSTPVGQGSGVLPANIRPGTPEAARYLAQTTGFWTK